VYSYPNIILAFFGGFIIDKITGVRLGTAVFCGLVFLGQLLFAIAVQFKIYPLMVVGRFIFGLGGESLTVGQNTYTTRWFEGDQIAFAFGIVLAFSRIGSSVNFLATPQFSHFGVPFAVWFGTAMCLLSFCAVFYVALLDWNGQPVVDRKERKANTSGEEPDVSLFHVFEFPFQSWIIFFICLLFYISVLTFYSVASDILQHIGDPPYPPDIATTFLAIPNFVAIFGSPFFGKLIDRTGRSLFWMAIACAMQIVAHVAFLAMAQGWFTIPPYVTMIWVGIGYSMFASSIWPLLPFCIRGEMLGTGYGTMTAIQNAGLAIFSQTIGSIQTAVGEESLLAYTIPIIIFIGCAASAFGLTIFLIVIDRARTGGVLNGTGLVKEAYKKDVVNAKRVVDPLNPTLGVRVKTQWNRIFRC